MFKVMIVDDMEVMRRDVKRLPLWGEDSGFIITAEAADGLDALRKLEADSIDLIIADIRMPNMDGIELLRIVSEKKLCPVTVLLSDFTEYSYARQGFLYGAFDYLSKPVDSQELAKLLARIKNHLDEKMEQEQKLQTLQEVAQRNLSIDDDSKHIVAYVQSGDRQKASFAFSGLIGKIIVQYEPDRSKLPIAVQNVMRVIISEAFKTCPWLDKYINPGAFLAADYSGCSDPEEIRTAAQNEFDKLSAVINRLVGCSDNKMVKQACAYTLNNIEEDISVKTLSEKLFVNKSYLSETFKKKFGITLLEYITFVKIERAKRLLQEGNLKNYQIAEQLGFKDVEYFGRLFKKYAGIPLKDSNN